MSLIQKGTLNADLRFFYGGIFLQIEQLSGLRFLLCFPFDKFSCLHHSNCSTMLFNQNSLLHVEALPNPIFFLVTDFILTTAQNKDSRLDCCNFSAIDAMFNLLAPTTYLPWGWVATKEAPKCVGHSSHFSNMDGHHKHKYVQDCKSQ